MAALTPSSPQCPPPTAAGPPLVGRARELAWLKDELERARAGRFGIVLLVAEAGVGKTRLTGELLGRHAQECICLSARAHALGDTTSFGLWAEAFEGHLRSCDPAEVVELCGGLLDDVAGLLRSAAVARGGIPDPEPSRAQLIDGLAVLLNSLGRSAPVVIFLDDVHVADASSWNALAYLARNLGDLPVLVIAAARTGELAAQAGPTQMVLGMEQDGLLRRLALGPLGEEAIAELAGSMVGGSPPPALVGWLMERSRGNPLFARGLLHALLDEGADLSAPRLRRLPEGLAERVVARLDGLPDAARNTVELLAVVGRRIELGDLVDLSGQPFQQVGPILDGLVRSQFLTAVERGRGVTYEILHPLAQEATYQGVGAARRHELHRRVARALLAAGHLGEAAPHYARSAEVGDAEAIDALCGAMRQAEDRQAYREALTILGHLVDLVPRGDERWLSVLDGMVLQAEWVVDHRADIHAALAVPALRTLDAMLEGTANAERRAAVKFRLASFTIWGTGELDAGLEAARGARALFEEAGNRQGPLLASLEEAFALAFAGKSGGWVPESRHLAELAEELGDRLAMMHIVGRGIGWGGFWTGRFDEAKLALLRAIDLAREDSKTYFHSLCLGGLAFTLAFEGRIAETDSVLAEAKTVNPQWRESLLPECEIWVRWLAGDFQGALDCAWDSVAWNTSGVSRRRGAPFPFAALAALETGRLSEAERLLAVSRTTFGEHPLPLTLQLCGHAQAVLDWNQTRDRRALARTEEAATEIQRVEWYPWAAFLFLDLAEIAADAGDLATGQRAAAGLEDVSGELDRDLYRALAAMARSWGALAGRKPKAAAEEAERALDLLPAGYQAFAGRALDLFGRAVASADRPRARSSLEQAATVFEGCGAARRRERTLKALARLGSSGQKAAAALGSGALTARETEVARLAARGHTAPDIARRLAIGDRTVESHMARIYAKLGVSSKGELIDRAADLGLIDKP